MALANLDLRTFEQGHFLRWKRGASGAAEVRFDPDGARRLTSVSDGLQSPGLS